MHKNIIPIWDAKQEEVRQWIRDRKKPFGSYAEILEGTLKILFPEKTYEEFEFPCHQRIVVVDHGNYQGTLVFVIGAWGYQPSLVDYWITQVSYGSCSHCDTLQSIESSVKGYDDDCNEVFDWNEQIISDYWTLALHMMQHMKSLRDL